MSPLLIIHTKNLLGMNFIASGSALYCVLCIFVRLFCEIVCVPLQELIGPL